MEQTNGIQRQTAGNQPSGAVDEAVLAAIKAAVQEVASAAIMAAVKEVLPTALRRYAVREIKVVMWVLDAVKRLESYEREPTIEAVASFLYMRPDEIERALQILLDDGSITVRTTTTEDGKQRKVYASVKRE